MRQDVVDADRQQRAGGVGLSEPLWRRQRELVSRARELVQGCECRAGCPACVGPVLAADEALVTSPKRLTLDVLDGLTCA